MPEERWRLFVAIPVGGKLRDELSAAVEQWKQRPDLAPLRWTQRGSWHVTLAFIGATDPREVPLLTSRLAAAVQGSYELYVQVGGLGGFPSNDLARVAWCGVADRHGRLDSMARRIREDLALPATPLRGHVTLARTDRGLVDLRRWVAEVSPPKHGVRAQRIHLVRSHLGPGLPRYETVGSFALRDIRTRSGDV